MSSLGKGIKGGQFGLNSWARHRMDSATLGGKLLRPSLQFGYPSRASSAQNAAFSLWWFGGVGGKLATTEAADIAAFAGTEIFSGTLATTEAADIAAFAGTVVSQTGAASAALFAGI